MRNVLFLFCTILLFSCSGNLQKKAENLIKSEWESTKPILIFENELTEKVDKEKNEIVGYQLIYELQQSNSNLKLIATFDKEVKNIISTYPYIEPENINIEDLPKPPSIK